MEIIGKRKQGAQDKNRPWCRARTGFSRQMMLRYGLHVEDLRDDSADCFNPDKLSTLHVCQVSNWDETHKKCVIGRMNKLSVKFRRDKNGKLDENGEFSQDDHFRLNVKYEKEVRLSLGCAIRDKRQDDDPEDVQILKCGREVVGVALEPFNYSGKKIVSIKEFNKLAKREFERVRTTIKDKKQWETDPNEPGALFREDDVIRIKRIVMTLSVSIHRCTFILSRVFCLYLYLKPKSFQWKTSTSLHDNRQHQLHGELTGQSTLPFSQGRWAWDRLCPSSIVLYVILRQTKELSMEDFNIVE